MLHDVHAHPHCHLSKINGTFIFFSQITSQLLPAYFATQISSHILPLFFLLFFLLHPFLHNTEKHNELRHKCISTFQLKRPLLDIKFFNTPSTPTHRISKSVPLMETTNFQRNSPLKHIASGPLPWQTSLYNLRYP